MIIDTQLINKRPVNRNCSAVCKAQCLTLFSPSKLFALVILKQMEKTLKQSMLAEEIFEVDQ